MTDTPEITESTAKTGAPPPTVWHSLSYDDAAAAVDFLTRAFGFVANGVYTDEAGRVVHAQLDWPPGGGIMLGSSRRDDDTWFDSVGRGACYCVTEHDEDVGVVHAQATAAGATSVRAPEDQGYGGRGCTVRDPEGNQWSFGSYRGEG